jgi:hypothetical protein
VYDITYYMDADFVLVTCIVCGGSLARRRIDLATSLHSALGAPARLLVLWILMEKTILVIWRF